MYHIRSPSAFRPCWSTLFFFLQSIDLRISAFNRETARHLLIHSFGIERMLRYSVRFTVRSVLKSSREEGSISLAFTSTQIGIFSKIRIFVPNIFYVGIRHLAANIFADFTVKSRLKLQSRIINNAAFLAHYSTVAINLAFSHRCKKFSRSRFTTFNRHNIISTP